VQKVLHKKIEIATVSNYVNVINDSPLFSYNSIGINAKSIAKLKASTVDTVNPKDFSTAIVRFIVVYDTNINVLNFNIVGLALTSSVSTINFYSPAASGLVSPINQSMSLNNIKNNIENINHSYFITHKLTSYSFTNSSPVTFPSEVCMLR